MSSEASESVGEGWTSWFCGASGNEFFCEVEKSYIEDSFNLFGLKQHLPQHYFKALDTILDRTPFGETESEEVHRAAVLLYGMIHARYIITAHGLDAMHRKYIKKEFGECPRMLCRGQPVLPMGFTDEPNYGMVKIFCPKCRDVYSCPNSQRHLDGAFFGPTFPNLFFMTYEGLAPEPATEQYVPTVFGFKIHPSSNSLPKLQSSSTSVHHRSSSSSGGGTGTGTGTGMGGVGGGEIAFARSRFIGNDNTSFGVHSFGNNITEGVAGDGKRDDGDGDGDGHNATVTNGLPTKSDGDSMNSSARPTSGRIQQGGSKRNLLETKSDTGEGVATSIIEIEGKVEVGVQEDVRPESKKRTKR